jgi:uncharacterized protein with FMN-binding domain
VTTPVAVGAAIPVPAASAAAAAPPSAVSPAPSPTPPPAATPPAVTAPTTAAPITDASGTVLKWRDGTFSGWGTSRHGDVEVTLIIERGRITTAAISRCLTRYSCSWIAHLQPQVVERQSPEVDNVSGATESANAFYYAVVEALKAARQ